MLLISISTGLNFINGNYKTYVKYSIDDDEFLTLVGVLGLVMNGLSRFLWNILFLKTGYKFVLTCMIIIKVAVYSTIRFTVDSKPAYMTEFLFSNLALGGFMVTSTTGVHAIFGVKIGSKVNGFFWCSIALGNWIAYLMVSNLSQRIGFDNIFYICLGLTLVNLPIVIFYNFQGPWNNQLTNLGWCPLRKE